MQGNHSRKAMRWSKLLRTAILVRDDFTCIYCNAPATQVDHVIPWEVGGPSRQNNGVAACRSCNQRKHSKLDPRFLIAAFSYLRDIDEDLAFLDDPRWESYLFLEDFI